MTDTILKIFLQSQRITDYSKSVLMYSERHSVHEK